MGRHEAAKIWQRRKGVKSIMKASSILLSLAAAAIASAQDPFYNITTPPFNLLIASEDHSINTTLSACHVGAALESLCLSNGNFGSSPTPLRAAEFQFNTSIYSQTAEPPILATGILTWWLRTDVDTKYSSSASFSYDPTTDLALPIIFPGEENAILLSWDAQNKLTIQSYIRGVNGNGSYKNFYRWYACETYYGSYNYKNLAWGLGADVPENQSCVPVNVTRVFV
ncbi:hypothetical protein CFE70_006148 [Pyrenophora teres f. teres 0-1]